MGNHGFYERYVYPGQQKQRQRDIRPHGMVLGRKWLNITFHFLSLKPYRCECLKGLFCGRQSASWKKTSCKHCDNKSPQMKENQLPKQLVLLLIRNKYEKTCTFRFLFRLTYWGNYFMMRPTKYPSSVKTVKLTLFPCLHVVSNRVNVPSDAE